MSWLHSRKGASEWEAKMLISIFTKVHQTRKRREGNCWVRRIVFKVFLLPVFSAHLVNILTTRIISDSSWEGISPTFSFWTKVTFFFDTNGQGITCLSLPLHSTWSIAPCVAIAQATSTRFWYVSKAASTTMIRPKSMDIRTHVAGDGDAGCILRVK